MAINISDLKHKVDNEPASENGRLSAAEFDRLVEAVEECQNGVKSIKYGGGNTIFPNETGLAVIPLLSEDWTGVLRIKRKVTRNYEDVYENVSEGQTYLYKNTDVDIQWQWREFKQVIDPDTGDTVYETSSQYVTVKLLKETSNGRTVLWQTTTHTPESFDSTRWEDLNLGSLLSAGDNNLIMEVSNTRYENKSMSFHILAANLNLDVANDNNWTNTALVVGIDDSITVEYYASGSVDRTLCVKYTGATGTTSTHRIFIPRSTSSTLITSDIFTSSEDTVDFFAEGLKRVEAWIEAGTGEEIVTSNVAINNIIVVQTGSTNKYVAIHGCIESMLNYEAATMFGYSIYTPTQPATVTFVLADSAKTNVYLETPVANRTINTLYDFASVLSIQSSLSTIHVYVFAKIGDTYVNNGGYIADFIVDNNADYGAVSGADFHLNPMLRSNQEDNPRRIINAVDGTVVTSDVANFQNISFQPGVDGWVEQNNIRFLRLLAGSTLTIPYDIYSQFTDNSRHGLTVEIDFAVRNITNEEDPILTIGNRNASNPKGVYMKALNGAFMNRSNTSWDSADVSWQEGVRTRLVFNFQHNYSLVSPENGRGRAASATIAIIRAYINGVINREVRVADVSNANEINAGGNIIIGQSGCDIDIYGIRVYKKNLTQEQVVKNYISTLPTVAEKKKIHDANDILENGVVSFEKALSAGLNCVVWHGKHLSRRYKDNPKRYGYYEIYRHNPDGTLDRAHSGVQYGVEASGQGTTAMTYADWNYSFKEDKKTGEGHDEYKYDVNGTLKNVFVDMDGVIAFGAAANKQKFGYQLKNGLPVAKKLVGKINYASPMQSHKMGACNLYNDLYARCVAGYGESGYAFDQTSCITNFSAGQRVTVIEEPFLYFVQEVEGADNTLKVFKGLSTFGPGKADKPTWGVSDTSMTDGDSLIEGALNNNPLTDMRVPFVDTIDSATGRYVCEYQIQNDQGSNVEAFVYAGAKNLNWGFGDTLELHDSASVVWPGVRDGDKTNADAPTTKQVKLWQPIFNFLYLMNTKIAPWKGANGDGLNAKLSHLNIAVRSNSFDSSVAYWMIDGDAGEGYSKFDLFRCHYNADGTKVYVPAGIHLVQGQMIYENFACLYDLTATPTGVTSYGDSDLWYDVSNPSNDTRDITLNLRTELSSLNTKNGLSDAINYNDDVDAVNVAMKKFICKIFRLYVDNNVYLHKKSVLFHHETMVLLAGTDNRSKNTYYRLNPYAVQTLNNVGHNWPNMEMNDDDLDTIFKTNNSGIQSKPYWVLEHDADPVTGPHWEGLVNVLNNTLNDAYGYGFLETGNKQMELSNMMGNIFNKMVSLANGQSMPDGTAVSADPIGCFDFYFFYIQKYFPAVTYNETARIRYEIPAVLYRSQSSDDGGEDYPQDPISQSLGDQYDSEKEYIRKRVTMLAGYAGYRMSEFGFRGYSGPYSVTLKPHQYIYPMYEVGDKTSSSPARSMVRVEPGNTYSFSFNNDSDTNGVYFYFIGSMREIGNIANWSNGTYSGEAETTAMAPSAARLVRFDMYSANVDGVVFNPRAGAFNLSACQNLEHIDVHNAYRLKGLGDLSNLVRLQDIDCRGTAIETLGLPSTPSLLSIKLPDSYGELIVRNCPNLSTLQFDGFAALETFIIEGTTNVSTLSVLMSIYGYNSAQATNVVRTVSLDNISWSNVTSEFLEWLINIENLHLTGTIAMLNNANGAIGFTLKKKLIERFGNVDNPNNSLYVIYTQVPVVSIDITGDGYFSSIGESKHYDILPNANTVNTMSAYQWSITGANAHMATIDSLGNVTCLSLGTESADTTITLNCSVTLINGNVLSDSIEVRLYSRQAHIGDYVYHDGTWDDIYNANKEVVGICFWSEIYYELLTTVPDDWQTGWTNYYTLNNDVYTKLATPSAPAFNDTDFYAIKYDRRMVALDDFENCRWGIFNNSGSSVSTGFSNLMYDSDGDGVYDTSCYHVPYITFLSGNSGARILSDTPDKPEGDAYPVGGFCDSIRVCTMIDPNTSKFYKYSENSAIGAAGLIPLSQVMKDDVFPNDASIDENTLVSIGFYYTAAIIRHRDKVLAGTNYTYTDSNQDTHTVNYKAAFAENPDINASVDNVLTQINRIQTYAGTDATLGGMGDSYTYRYTEYLYPAASFAFTYEPKSKSGGAIQNLNPKFKIHKWYLPSSGEMARLAFFSVVCFPGPWDLTTPNNYYVSREQGNPFGDIFANAVNRGIYTRLRNNNRYWSSMEESAARPWNFYLSVSQINGGFGKYQAFNVRPCAMF